MAKIKPFSFMRGEVSIHPAKRIVKIVVPPLRKQASMKETIPLKFLDQFKNNLHEADFTYLNTLVKEGVALDKAVKESLVAYVEPNILKYLQGKQISGYNVLDYAAALLKDQYLKWLHS